ncbi:MAG: hypothetical protein ACREML_08765, partial [Vulcanimicrobiaceae bacterium]
DVDFVTPEDRRRVTEALSEIGFMLNGRIYTNETTDYTVDIVGSTPYIEQRLIADFVTIQTDLGALRVISLEDAIADRVAHWLHWSDNEALDIAQQTIEATKDRLDAKKLRAAIHVLSRPDEATTARYDVAMRRITRALEA